MDSEEAVRIAQIIATADKECGFCAGRLAKKMKQAFPEHDWYSITLAAAETFPFTDYIAYKAAFKETYEDE